MGRMTAVLANPKMNLCTKALVFYPRKQGSLVASYPHPHPTLHQLQYRSHPAFQYVLQAMESWVGPGYEASSLGLLLLTSDSITQYWGVFNVVKVWFVLTESTISGSWHSNDPRPSPDFSPWLRDKIWDWAGDEANVTFSFSYVS